MPVVLSNEKSTPYPVKQINLGRIDSNLDYFVISKEISSSKRRNIGEIKIIDDVNSEVFLCWFDDKQIVRLGCYDELSQIFSNMMDEYDIICITDEDTSKVSCSGSVGYDFDNYNKLRREIVEKLFHMVDMRLR